MKQQRNIVVKKFGGTSVGSIERIHAIADRIIADQKAGQNPVIVVSAMSGETQRLIQLASQVDPQAEGGLGYDMLLASGEQVSVALLTLALQHRGCSAVPLLAHQLGIKTDAIFSRAKIQSIDEQQLFDCVDEGTVPVIAGFQGMAGDGRITTMGRGGSDTTAVAVAGALGCKECEIYTDVSGICTADPRLVSKASKIDRLAFNEMLEMSALGSKVLHLRAVELALKYRIQLHLRSSFISDEGTWVVPEGECMENPVVSAVTHQDQVVVIRIFAIEKGVQYLAELFEKLADRSVVVDIITQSENEDHQRLSFSIEAGDKASALSVVKEVFGDSVSVEVVEDVAKLSVVGVGMRNHHGVAAQFFRKLLDLGVESQLVTTSDIKISTIIKTSDLKKAAQGVHELFCETETGSQ